MTRQFCDDSGLKKIMGAGYTFEWMIEVAPTSCALTSIKASAQVEDAQAPRPGFTRARERLCEHLMHRMTAAIFLLLASSGPALAIGGSYGKDMMGRLIAAAAVGWIIYLLREWIIGVFVVVLCAGLLLNCMGYGYVGH